jgi:cytochrome c5
VAAVSVNAIACAPKAKAAPAQTTTVNVAVSEALPDGPGRQILMNACTSCHNLREVTKFRGFYVRAQWHDVVLTMRDYGAPVNEKEVELLTDFLTANLGKK